MWRKILEFGRKILAWIQQFGRKILAWFQHLLGIKPYIPSDSERGVAEKVVQPEPKPPEKPLALPFTTDRYEKIDWENKPPPYQKKRGVLSYREAQFHRILVRLINNEYQVLSMVRMADVIYLSKDIEDRKSHNINISSKHFDFVLCDKLKFAPRLVIELDDPTHLYYYRKEIDDFKEKACEVAGLPLLRVKVQHTYNEEELKEKIRQKLASSANENG